MQSNKKYTPGQAIWETTLKCNLKCLHCGSSAGEARSDELNTQESVNLIKDLSEINTKEICLMGGEPFLRKDWFTLAETINDYNIGLHFISNGYLVNEKTVEKLRKLQPRSLTISLDGAREKTHDFIRGVKGSHKRILNAIELAKKADIPVTLITTVSILNLSELPEIKDMIFKKNIAWQIQIAMPEGRFSESYALTKEQYYSVALFIANIQKKYTKKELQ